MHDGSKLYLKKVAEDYDPTDKLAAMRLLHETARRGEFATGVLYIEPDKDDFLDAAEHGRRAAGDAAARARPPGTRGARRGHGIASGRRQECDETAIDADCVWRSPS